jgi:hypothetical protein
MEVETNTFIDSTVVQLGQTVLLESDDGESRFVEAKQNALVHNTHIL